MANEILSRGCLYRLSFPNGKCYIGITNRTAIKRFSAHEYMSRTEKRNAVHHAIAKFGASNVKVETLVVADWDFLLKLEVKAILAYGTRAPSGYNLTDGGDGVVCPDAITREKMGRGQRGKCRSNDVKEKISAALKGIKRSEQTCLQIGLAHKGKTISKEQRAALSISNTGKKQSKETIAKRIASNTGKIRSADHCKRMSEINIGRPVSEETRKKISNSLMGNKINLGRVQSAETKAKISATLKSKSAKEKYYV